MADDFEEAIFNEFYFDHAINKGMVVKSGNAEISGKAKISIEEDSHDGIKIILKKDENDAIKEIKFVCSCGQSKAVVLDYTDQ